MQCSMHRRLAFIDAPSAEKAVLTAKNTPLLSPLTVIDMTADFNQNKWLGQELGDTLIYFADHSRPNGLLAVLGCVKAPHAIILACDSGKLRDYFKQHIFLPQLKKLISTQASGAIAHKTQADFSAINDCEMQGARQKLLNATGICHLIGERGSGKSTLLGRVLADFSQRGERHILLSSPLPAASKNTLSSYYAALEKTDVSRETLRYCSPNELVKNLEKATIVVIDEAASYPRNLLQAVIKHVTETHKKFILSTTIEGYEGTGQSYRLHYLNHLESYPSRSGVNSSAISNSETAFIKGDKKHQSFSVYLNNPKRFSSDDPLYQCCQSLYYPDTHLDTSCSGIFVLTTAELRRRGWTAACFALLREAHYKTTPNDLARFYSDDAIFAVHIEAGEVIAAIYALVDILPSDVDVQDIFHGKRRVKNAFTQQALINAYGELSDENKGNRQLFYSRILRISRIAAAKNHRRKKIATKLLAKLQSEAINRRFAFLSTSFSGSARNMHFWLAQAFIPARIGLYPNKINAEYAVLMLKALNADGETIQYRCATYFQRHLQYFSSTYLPQHRILLVEDVSRETSTTQQVIRELSSVLDNFRDIHWTLPVISHFIQSNHCDMLDVDLAVFKGEIHNKQNSQQTRQVLQQLQDYLSEKK